MKVKLKIIQPHHHLSRAAGPRYWHLTFPQCLTLRENRLQRSIHLDIKRCMEAKVNFNVKRRKNDLPKGYALWRGITLDRSDHRYRPHTSDLERTQVRRSPPGFCPQAPQLVDEQIQQDFFPLISCDEGFELQQQAFVLSTEK